MESMALVPPAPLGLAYVDVFLIKSQYIKQNQSTYVFAAWRQTNAGEVLLHVKKSPSGRTESGCEIQAETKLSLTQTKGCFQ